jgi:hypothetical protein
VVLEEQTLRGVQFDVLVTQVVSPLDTGSIHGRGQGVLRRDRTVGVTFLLDQEDFVALRARLLEGEGDVGFPVAMQDVTAISSRR